MQYSIEGDGPGASITRILQEVGFEVGNERDLTMGMLAYNCALLMWQSHLNNKRKNERERVGRNELCPCGSGKKYKKCCLQKPSNLPGTGVTRRFTDFSPMFIPKLYSVGGISDDCQLLGRVMNQDEDLKKVLFSQQKVEEFLRKAIENRKGRKNLDIDQLAARYAREFENEGRLIEDLKDKFLAAAPRSNSEEEIRALSIGYFFSCAAGDADGPQDNILAAMIFRRTLYQIPRPYVAIDGIIQKMGGNEVELRKRFEAGDPSVYDELKLYAEALGESDKGAIRAFVNRQHDDLWEVISSDRFPVLIPFVTMLPFWMEVHMFAKEGKEPAPADFERIMELYTNEFLEEDCRLYKSLLDGWLHDNPRRRDDVEKAVRTMAGLCAVQSMDPFIKMLLVSTGRQKILVTLDNKEREIIKSWKDLNEVEFLNSYSEWLRSKGYPKLAKRTLSLLSVGGTEDGGQSKWSPPKNKESPHELRT